MTVALVALLYAVARADLLPGLPNPFAEETKDRSGPAVLQSIQNMSRFEGASGNFQVVVDLEKDATFLPDAVRGERTLFIGAGGVDAYVDLGEVADDGMTISEDRRTAAIRLPGAQLERTSLDPERSYVVARERGVFDRIGGFFSDNPADEKQLHILAADKIRSAAEESGLADRAETNTRSMLQRLLTALGFTEVTVTFDRRQ